MKPLVLSSVILLACLLSEPVTAGPADLMKGMTFEEWLRANGQLVERQLDLVGLPIEASVDSEVAGFIGQYLRTGRREAERMLGRASYYLPVFERILEAHGLPASLKYLPIVESGLFPQAQSPAGAVGLWQFVESTASGHELEINRWVDERRDPYRSSEAAAGLLATLFGEFGDWNLALAAYNCGSGRVRKAVRRAGSTRYEAIRLFLPGQTRQYLAKYKAVAYVTTFHQSFGLVPDSKDRPAPGSVRIPVNRSISFREVARLSGVSVAEVARLNPAFIQGVIPAADSGRIYLLTLPLDAAGMLIARLAHGTPDQKQAVEETHSTRTRGETKMQPDEKEIEQDSAEIPDENAIRQVIDPDPAGSGSGGRPPSRFLPANCCRKEGVEQSELFVFS